MRNRDVRRCGLLWLLSVLFVAAPTHAATLSAWQLTTPLPIALSAHAMTATTTHVYALGGVEAAAVNVAPILPDGSLGTWTATTALTFPRVFPGAAVVGKYLYVIGGASGPNLATRYAAVERAEILPDGALGPWTTMASLTHPRAHMAVVSDGHHLYAVGGYDGTRTNSVEMTTVASDGSLAAWQAVAGMTVGRQAPAAGIANGRLYAAGGLGAGVLASTEGAVIQADGTLATWQGMAPLSTARYQAVGAGAAGTVWVAGGYNDNSPAFFSSTEQAVCDAGGVITGWMAGPAMTAARVSHAGAVSGTRFYVSGGTSGGPAIASVEFAQALPAPTAAAVGVFRPSDGTFYLDKNGSGTWEGCGTDSCLQIGQNGDTPLVGDWNGSGTSKVGVFRPSDGAFYLDYNGNGQWDGCGIDRCLQFGLNGDVPLVGDWNGSGTSKVGAFRPSDGTFYLDYNGNGVWDGCGTDKCLSIGMTGDIPLVGKW